MVDENYAIRTLQTKVLLFSKPLTHLTLCVVIRDREKLFEFPLKMRPPPPPPSRHPVKIITCHVGLQPVVISVFFGIIHASQHNTRVFTGQVILSREEKIAVGTHWSLYRKLGSNGLKQCIKKCFLTPCQPSPAEKSCQKNFVSESLL